MVSFAPFDEPRYAVALVVENGESGSRSAAPLVGLLLQQIFAIEQVDLLTIPGERG